MSKGLRTDLRVLENCRFSLIGRKSVGTVGGRNVELLGENRKDRWRIKTTSIPDTAEFHAWPLVIPVEANS